MPLALLALLYFMMIRPQRRQEKKQQDARSKLKVGDQVITLGGLMGKIVNIKDDEITIATSVAQSLVTFRRDAVNPVVQRKETAQEQAAEGKKRPSLFGRSKKEEN